jgi:hypothetical protein
MLILLLSASPSFAQKGTVVKKSVRFAKGSSSAKMRGSAVWGTSYQYTFVARAGQKVKIALDGDPTFSFRLLVPPEADGEQPAGNRDDVRKWSGVLEDGGRYEIVVSQTRDGVAAAPYTLTLEIH